jgi:hypothetical protein
MGIANILDYLRIFDYLSMKIYRATTLFGYKFNRNLEENQAHLQYPLILGLDVIWKRLQVVLDWNSLGA